MRVSSLLTCLWPGLPQLWWEGSWRALLTACGFAMALNLVVVASLVWPEAWSPTFNRLSWISVVVFWVVTAAQSWRRMPQLRCPARNLATEDLLKDAQAEYLSRHWFEAEATLKKLLKRHDKDLEARLMLASLYRHTRRFDDAKASIARLECLDGAERWTLEIQREKLLIDRYVKEQADGSAELTPSKDANQPVEMNSELK